MGQESERGAAHKLKPKSLPTSLRSRLDVRSSRSSLRKFPALDTTGDSSVVVHHAVYSSVIQCTLSDVGEQPMAIPAEIRLWCPPSQPLHPDNTVAFVVAKAYIPSPGSLPNMALLDALYLIPFPGDADTDEYEDHIPDFPNPLVTTLGTVSASGSDLSTSHHCFPLSVREYVRDENKNSVIL